ncbi:MAG: hypothetical protein LBK00_08730 [Treponema sp.]|nr:hypothetical protein [Treponema sp.]
MNIKNCFKHMTALLAMLFAGLCVTPGAWAQYAGAGEGRVYIGIFTFAEEVYTIFAPKEVDKATAGDVVDNALSLYDISGNSGTLLYRAVQTGLSALKEDSSRFPLDVTSISLLTFTDGLDQGSTMPSLPPIGRERISFGMKTTDEARQILQGQFDDLQRDGIALRNGNRIPVDVYSIGLMGPDVTDARAFQQSLQDIASNPTMAIKADDIQMVKREFNRIAQDLFTKTIATKLSIPAPGRGTKVRWTFDVPSATKTGNISYNFPEAAMGSRYYIEGDFDYDVNGTPLMRNIVYSGVSFRDEAGRTIRGEQNSENRAMVDFSFYELEAGSTGNNEVREWLMEPGKEWQANVETDTDIEDTESQSTAVIYLVLDQSKSMSKDGIAQVKEAVRDLIDVFVPIKEYTQPTRPVAPAREPTPAYSDNLPNYVFVDFAPLLVGMSVDGFGIGLGYEKAFADPFSIAFYADFISASTVTAWDLLIRPRWYPSQSAVSKWYLGAILGYGMAGSTSALTIGLETGYKFVFGHFGLEPWMGLTFGAYGGFKIGATLGYVW